MDVVIPLTWRLTESVETPMKTPFTSFLAVRNLNTCRRLKIKFFLHIAMEEGCLNVKFMYDKIMLDS
jgi:hypothetical protein